MPTIEATYQRLLSVYQQHQQAHVFQFFQTLNEEQKSQLLAQLDQIDPGRVNSIFAKAMSESAQRESGGNTINTVLIILTIHRQQDYYATITIKLL